VARRRRRRSEPGGEPAESASRVADDAAEAAARLAGMGTPGGPSLSSARRRRRAPVDPELLRRAQSGDITRATASTEAELSAIYRTEYLARRASRPDLSARQALGHRAPEPSPPSITALVDLPGGGVGYRDFDGLRPMERGRIGRHEGLIGQLIAGRISAAAFRRRVRRWAPVGGFKLASDPGAVISAVTERRAAGEPLGPYPEGAT